MKSVNSFALVDPGSREGSLSGGGWCVPAEFVYNSVEHVFLQGMVVRLFKAEVF